MFFFKWATLLLAVWRHSAGTESPGENKLCQHGSCFNLSVAGQTAEAGLCVVIPCSFTTNEKHTAQHVAWYKCEGSEHTCNKSLIFDSNKNEPASEFKERVSMLEPDLSKKNCSITIRNLKKSDSGFYEVRVYGKFSGTKDDYMLSNKTNITVTENVFHDTVKSSNLTFNLSAEHHGAQVTCKISFTGNMNTEETLTLNVTGVKESGITEQSSKHLCTNQITDTTVTSPLTFSNNSGCHKESDVLTCVCIFDGFPIHSIHWPLIKNYTNYSVITTVTNHTVNSSLTVTVTDDMNTTIKCDDMIVVCHTQREEDAGINLFEIVQKLEVIVAFFIGVLLSTIFCCLMRVCCRKKHKTPANVETMEMVIHQESPLIEDGQAVEDDHSDPQEAAEAGAGAAAGKSDVEYSTIHFSASKSNSVAKLENLSETPETEYAEIKTEAVERRAGEDRQETGNMEEAEEAGGDALYSDVKDVMGEI
ncbi:Sialic acid-binding Ig-like lectin 12 [Channa argus]|uniref:Sialic acid-binding Ig-like lectin 12 n=1 Tax=Channa argus TaxID=215402 RepID=A0A6G1PPL0_CHAAH|nr:Sialic acid-binding Ig-like lectin 12 [Channa argus]